MAEYCKGRINIKNIERGHLFVDITKIENVTEGTISSYGAPRGLNPSVTFLTAVYLMIQILSTKCLSKKHQLAGCLPHTKKCPQYS